ncbi:MAG: ThuA domain-containing protein [Clostridia bacterium]|nr:ThuA domain-containing protein [Clostridia bacterium]
MKKALIFQGGWQGHNPGSVSAHLGRLLEARGIAVEIYGTLDCLSAPAKLAEYSLIVPCWTMGTIPHEYIINVMNAVRAGTGLAGCHGGMCDAFRNDTEWQFLTGGQWVAHPGNDGVEYTVNLRLGHEITDGMADFHVKSEQYYMHVDPAVKVLATTVFKPSPETYGDAVEMPVVWTKQWGRGKVFYCSLGHNAALFERTPEASLLMERGMLWAMGE